jgi:hypothetical protein
LKPLAAIPPPVAPPLEVAAAPARPDALALFDLTQKPGYYNAKAKSALLRRSARPPHDELLVGFSRAECYLEVRASSTALLAGTWSVQAAAAGSPLIAAGPWEESCWETDEDCDFLEIELPLSGGWRLERQMLLARRDRFLLLADALLAPPAHSSSNTSHGANGSSPSAPATQPPVQPPAQPSELHYASSLALASRAAFRPAAETREGWLESNNRRMATVIPVALPEWRAEFCHGQLAADGGQLNLEHRSLGRNLYAPLWIDLDPTRLRRPLTWRRITVGENLAAVTRDAAAAYRIQAGTSHWLFYRSLTKPANRSYLGHNTHYEFVCQRFLATGDTEPIIEIE